MVLPPKALHPADEAVLTEKRPLSTAIEVETFAGRVHVEWDPTAAVTPIGQLPFFIEFLKLGHRFNPWVEQCPLHYESNSATRSRLEKLFSWKQRGPPVPPGESTGMNQELPRQCNEARLVRGPNRERRTLLVTTIR